MSESYCGCPDEFRCICDPADVFDPPDPTPRAVDGCPAHRARRAYQQWAAEQPEPARGVGWRLARDEEIQDAAHMAAMEERMEHEAEQSEGSGYR